MRAALLLSLLKSSTGSPTVSNPSNSVARSFGPLDAQVPACIPGDQSIDGIRSRSCNEFGFKLADSANDKTKLTLGSSVGRESQLIAGVTSHGPPAASVFNSPYLLASSSGDSINLLQLGGTALAAAFSLFIACAQSIINRLSSSGTAHLSGAISAAETPGSDAKSGGEVNFPSTVLDGTTDQDQESSPCPVEIYAYRQLALCDIGIQSIQYSELDDMFILIKPTLFLGACTSLSFVPHFCCDPEATLRGDETYVNCWPYPIDWDMSDLPQSALSTYPWWEFFNPRF